MNLFDMQSLIEELKNLNSSQVIDVLTRDSLIEYYKELKENIRDDVNWESFKTFWPPRIIQAYKDGNLICFFGAGISQPSGLPSWSTLLNNYLDIDKVYTTDKDLENDPLTLAEIASHQIGADKVQTIIRQSFNPYKTPAVSHYLLSAMRLPVYITTNYDSLFKSAWSIINPTIKLHDVVNTSDLNKILVSGKLPQDEHQAFLFKIHGCSERLDEQMILTRSDYRHHYRYNKDFFDFIKQILLQNHILFLGFSHSDPEVTRIIEDVIWQYESQRNEYAPKSIRPNYYSLQFNMKTHTPEIFAAKGIVALNPPIVNFETKDARSQALCEAIGDLIGASSINFHAQLSLDIELKKNVELLEEELENGLKALKNYSNSAEKQLSSEVSPNSWMKNLLSDLGQMGNQGIYLVNEFGKIVDLEVPDGLNKVERQEFVQKTLGSFRERPYFRQAKTFRKAFVSDSAKSVYNGFSTVFFCLPILKHGHFFGLLFSACQIGIWEKPLMIARNIWNKNYSIILVDANGVCLMPSNNEFQIENNNGLDKKECEGKNKGYSFTKLLSFSRKDRLVSRIMENVVPIDQDDDVLSLSNDLKYYSVISEMKVTRWKFGIACPIFLAKAK